MFQGDEYVFYEDWGEQLVGKSCPVVCVLDVEAGIVSTLDNLPDNISPGQVTFFEICFILQWSRSKQKEKGTLLKHLWNIQKWNILEKKPQEM